MTKQVKVNKFLLDDLDEPSYIKKIPFHLSENSANWLIERLQSIVADYSESSINNAYEILTNQWYEYTDREADKEIQQFNKFSPFPNIVKTWLENLTLNDEPPHGIEWQDHGYGNYILVITDPSYAKEYIYEQLDELYPTNIERFQLLKNNTGVLWKGKTEYGDSIEYVDSFVAAVATIEMLAGYLREVISKGENNLSLNSIYNLDQIHQAHFITSEYFFNEIAQKKLNKTILTTTKQTLSMRAAAGGKAKAKKTGRIKQHVLNAYKTNSSTYKSTRQASISLAKLADEFARANNLTPLVESNAERTIYDWLRRAKKDNEAP
ncbi:hypothetical protein [Neptunomonas sp.]|uniref:hypothetical protein n=1 Tax=Neptunomonas sp. TaxID=1971898 RepID=UPI00356AEF25